MVAEQHGKSYVSNLVLDRPNSVCDMIKGRSTEGLNYWRNEESIQASQWVGIR